MDMWQFLKDNAKEVIDSSGNAISKSIDDSAKTLSDQATITKDRIKMMNPDVQGPRLPDTTPKEDEFYDKMVTGVAGSVVPVKKLQGIQRMLAGKPAAMSEKALQEVEKDFLKSAVTAIPGNTSKPLIQEGRQLAEARANANAVAEAAVPGGTANINDVGRVTNVLGRNVDKEEAFRKALEQKAAMRKAALKKLTGE